MSISTGFTGRSSGEASDVPNANKTAEVIKWLSAIRKDIGDKSGRSENRLGNEIMIEAEDLP